MTQPVLVSVLYIPPSIVSTTSSIILKQNFKGFLYLGLTYSSKTKPAVS